MPAIVRHYSKIENNAGLDRSDKPYRRKLLRPSKRMRLCKHAAAAANLAFKVTAESDFAFFTQASRAFFDDRTVNLRHACRRCTRPRRKRKDMELRQPAGVDQIERTHEHVL